MAAGILPEPGSEFGPCSGDCEHKDCAATRVMAESECVHCDEPIGYGVRFYRVDTFRSEVGIVTHHVYAHATCEEN